MHDVIESYSGQSKTQELIEMGLRAELALEIGALRIVKVAKIDRMIAISDSAMKIDGSISDKHRK